MKHDEVPDPLLSSTPDNPDEFPNLVDENTLIERMLSDPELFRWGREFVRRTWPWRGEQSAKAKKTLLYLATILRELAYFGRNKRGIQGLLMSHEERQLPASDNPILQDIQRDWAGKGRKD